MTDKVSNPHDAFFKQYLSQPNVAVDFLRQHLPAAVRDLLDLTQLRLEKDSFVDEKLRGYFSDLVYTTVTRQQTPLRVAFLCEHKSYPDAWVDFQTLRYQVGYWVQEFDKLQAEPTAPDSLLAQPARNSRRQTLTPILVLLVYHGSEAWQVELRFARHLNGMEVPDSPLAQALGRYVPDFEPHFINLSSMADEAIQGEVVTRLFVLVLKHIFEHGLGGHLDEILRLASQVMRQPSGMEMVMALLRYIGRSAVKINKAEMTQKLIDYLPKEGGILMETMAQEWIEEGKRIGLKEGIKEGIKEGESHGRAKTILQMLNHRFQPSSEMIQPVEQQLVQIIDEARLSQLVNIALEAPTLADFVLQMQGLLPSSAAEKR